MKYAKIVLAALVAVLLLASCYMVTDTGTSTVGIELPDPRSMSSTDEEPAEFARIYVINGANLVAVGDGTPYKEITFNLEDDERVTQVSVGPVPSGDGYEVVAVFGDKEPGAGGADVFVPVLYAMSEDTFTVHGGQTTETPELELLASPFVAVDPDQTLGANLLGVVFNGSRLYTATSAKLLESDPLGGLGGTVDFPSSGVALPTGYTVNSITLGADRTAGAVPWLNTDKGLLPYITGGTGFDEDFDNRGDVPGYNPTDKDWNVLDSGGFVFNNPLDAGDPLNGDVFGYFQFEGGLGGVWDDDGTLKWMSPARMDDLVTGQPILDLDVQLHGTVHAYIASKLGAFVMPQELLTEEPAGDVSPAQRVLDMSTFFEVEIDGTAAQITHVSIGSDTDAHLYLGTPRGALKVPVGDIGTVEPPLKVDAELVDGTERLAVVDLVSTGNLVVVLTEHFLIYSVDSGETFTRVPVYASSVGVVSGMLLDPSTGSVLITGSTGLVGTDVTP